MARPSAFDTISLPTGWKWERIGLLCTEERTPAPSRSTLRLIGLEHIESWTGRVSGEFTNGQSGQGGFTFSPEHVLYGKLRPYLNKVATPDFAGRCTTELIPLRPRGDVDRDFLARLLRRPETVEAVMAEKTGSRMPRADMRKLFGLLVALPPLAEQKRIVTSLVEQLAEVERARRAVEVQIEAAEALDAAYLGSVFENEEAKQWRRARLAEVAAITGGVQRTPDRVPVDFHRPYLTVRNVQRGYIDLTQVERFELTRSELQRLRLVAGDLLLVEGNGSNAEIGRNAIFPESEEEWIHQNHIIRVRLDQERCLPQFASFYLNGRAGKNQMVDKARTTSGLYTLSAQKVASLEIPVPPLNKQRAIIKTLIDRNEVLVGLRDQLEVEHEAIQNLPNALLRRALKEQS
jgi:type I restriction enzyme S subunit